MSRSLWVLEAFEEYPEADAVEGLDIAIHQAPAKHLLPENVHFKYFNAYEDVPFEYIGRYDLIHARFLLGLVKDDNPIPLIENLMQMLSESASATERRQTH